VETQDFATTYRLHLTITPGTPGFNRFDLQVLDYVSRKPVRVDSVSIGFHYPDKPSVGDSTLPLTRQPNGTYTGKGANMGLLGHWELSLLVQNGTSSVDPHVDVVTRTPPEPTQVQSFVGAPTVSTVSLPGSRKVQVYLDPLNHGLAEFHATFLDAAGKELHMATFAVTAARSPGGAVGGLLTARNLDNLGHFVADARVPKGTYIFDLAGTTTDGDALGATLTLPVK
jgi:hypothetical protein